MTQHYQVSNPELPWRDSKTTKILVITSGLSEIRSWYLQNAILWDYPSKVWHQNRAVSEYIGFSPGQYHSNIALQLKTKLQKEIVTTTSTTSVWKSKDGDDDDDDNNNNNNTFVILMLILLHWRLPVSEPKWMRWNWSKLYNGTAHTCKLQTPHTMLNKCRAPHSHISSD